MEKIEIATYQLQNTMPDDMKVMLPELEEIVKIEFIWRIISYNSSDNKMTIQFPENPRTRYNPDKTPGFPPPKTTKNTTEQL